MLQADRPALVLAPMDGITDAPMRALQGEIGAFTYAVSEFQRVSGEPLPAKVFRREVPEIGNGSITPTGLPVQTQILGGHAGRMAASALTAVRAGATAIDINFGCPAPTVNRHDGGASLLKHPERIREIVREVRAAVPPEIPVSAKMRLGWDTIDSIHLNAEMAAEGGATWITIHARTRTQGYNPPVFWRPIGEVRAALDVPVIANGDIWTLDDFRRCRDMTGCRHFMLGRSAMADPHLSWAVAADLGLPIAPKPCLDWPVILSRLVFWLDYYGQGAHPRPLQRMKQWLSLARRHGDFPAFDRLKRLDREEEFFEVLRDSQKPLIAV